MATQFSNTEQESDMDRNRRAVADLTESIKTSASPTLLLARSKAYQKLGKLEAALHDADAAYHAAIKRGSDKTHEFVIEAQYRRAVVLFALGRYADADCCARWSQLLVDRRPVAEQHAVTQNVDSDGNYLATVEQARDEYNARMESPSPRSVPVYDKTDTRLWTRAYMWRSQTLWRMEKLPLGDPARKVTVDMVPPLREVVKEVEIEAAPGTAENSAETDTPETSSKQMAAETDNEKTTVEEKPVSDEQLKLRTSFYQSSDTVTVTLYVKGVDKEALTVDFQADKVSLIQTAASISLAYILTCG